MKLNFSLIFTLSIFALAGCNSDKSIKEDKTQTAVEPEKTIVIPPQGSLTGDTISLTGKFILFYGPEVNDNVDEQTASFIQTTKAIIDSVTLSSPVFVTYTSANNIRIFSQINEGAMMIMRNTFSEPHGLILSDGLQSPTIKKGLLKEEDYHKLIQNYFLQPS